MARRRFISRATSSPGRSARRDAPSKISAFVQLLEAVHEIEGLERIRFTSPHPKGYGDDLVEAYARLPKLVRKRAHPRAKRQRPGAQTHAPRLHARTVSSASSKNCAKPNRTSASPPTSSSVFPAKRRRTSSKRCRLCREVEFDKAYHFQILAAHATRPPPKCRTRCPRRSKRNATSACWNW